MPLYDHLMQYHFPYACVPQIRFSYTMHVVCITSKKKKLWTFPFYCWPDWAKVIKTVNLVLKQEMKKIPLFVPVHKSYFCRSWSQACTQGGEGRRDTAPSHNFGTVQFFLIKPSKKAILTFLQPEITKLSCANARNLKKAVFWLRHARKIVDFFTFSAFSHIIRSCMIKNIFQQNKNVHM